MKPEHPKSRVCYRKFASINKRDFSGDIRNAFAVTSGTRIASVDNYNSAIETISTSTHRSSHASPLFVRGHRGIRKHLSCAKRDLRRAERRWRKTRLTVHRQIYTTVIDGYCRQLTTTKASHLCTVIREAGYNIKTMFGVTNALLNQSAPAQYMSNPTTSRLLNLSNSFWFRKLLPYVVQ